jgi:hypothetical protein
MTRRKLRRKTVAIPAAVYIKRLRSARDTWRSWAIATTILSVGLALAGMVTDPSCLPPP